MALRRGTRLGTIVHRDVKPENVFVLDDGQVKVLDFGLAKSAAPDVAAASAASAATVASPALTEGGVLLGTAGYMSPEQVRGDLVDHRTDLFAFGCMLYELVTGRRAFQGDSAIDTLHATLHADPDLADVSAVSALAENRKAREEGDRSFAPLYEDAALQLMLGNRDAALDLFDKAIDAGSVENVFPKVDPLMAGMRHEPRFVASLARVDRVVSEMRQRVDFKGLEEWVR